MGNVMAPPHITQQQQQHMQQQISQQQYMQVDILFPISFIIQSICKLEIRLFCHTFLFFNYFFYF